MLVRCCGDGRVTASSKMVICRQLHTVYGQALGLERNDCHWSWTGDLDCRSSLDGQHRELAVTRLCRDWSADCSFDARARVARIFGVGDASRFIEHQLEGATVLDNFLFKPNAETCHMNAELEKRFSARRALFFI